MKNEANRGPLQWEFSARGSQKILSMDFYTVVMIPRGILSNPPFFFELGNYCIDPVIMKNVVDDPRLTFLYELSPGLPTVSRSFNY